MLLNILIFSLFFIGVCFIVYSVIKFKPVDQSATQAATEETIQKLEASVADADNALEELNRMSQKIFDEMTAKYKELLYLYQLVEQKQSRMSSAPAPNLVPPPASSFASNQGGRPQQERSAQVQTPPPMQQHQQPTPQDNHDFMSAFNSSNPKHDDIKKLHKQGMSISEIAKHLNLGQGEVSLVLQMGRG